MFVLIVMGKYGKVLGIPFLFLDPEYLGSVDSRVLTEHCKHVELEDIGTCSDGCCDEMRCKQCGETFMVEVPD